MVNASLWGFCFYPITALNKKSTYRNTEHYLEKRSAHRRYSVLFDSQLSLESENGGFHEDVGGRLLKLFSWKIQINEMFTKERNSNLHGPWLEL